MKAFLGIDVGTGSARAGLFDETGRIIGRAHEAIETYRPSVTVQPAPSRLRSGVERDLASEQQEEVGRT